MNKTLALGMAAALLSIGAWSFGCSSSSSGGTTDDAGTGGGTDSGVKKDGGSTGGDSGGTGGDDSGATGDAGGGNPDQACAANGADADSCSNCCVNNHMTGQKTFITAVHTCECGANGPCKTACTATFCASTPKNPDQACLTCLTNDLTPDAGTACYGQVDQACTADPDCVAEQNCFGICP